MKKKKTGFTLLELVIAMGITIIVLGIAGSMFTTGNKVFSDSDVKSTLQIEGQSIQEKISDIGMQGIDIVSTPPFPPVIIKSYVKEDDTPRYFKIKRDGNKLILNKDTEQSCSDTNNDVIITENLRSLTISSNENKSIDFDIVLAKKKGFSDVSQEFTFTINLRNKGN